MRRRWIIAGLVCLGLAFATLPFIPGIGDSLDVPVGESAGCDPKAKPANLDFVLQDMDGRDVNLADYRGKVIMLNFWATWCGPCKIEIPAFVELQEKYRDEGVVFLGLSVDDPVEKLKPFAEEFRMNYPVLVGNGRDDVQEAFGPIWGIPVTVMIGRNGQICKRHMGFATKDQFEQALQSLL
jgi:cytochrome c biogenesis protein CcmG/thiol:disulfide interchange protein DsbE